MLSRSSLFVSACSYHVSLMPSMIGAWKDCIVSMLRKGREKGRQCVCPRRSKAVDVALIYCFYVMWHSNWFMRHIPPIAPSEDQHQIRRQRHIISVIMFIEVYVYECNKGSYCNKGCRWSSSPLSCSSPFQLWSSWSFVGWRWRQ